MNLEGEVREAGEAVDVAVVHGAVGARVDDPATGMVVVVEAVTASAAVGIAMPAVVIDMGGAQAMILAVAETMAPIALFIQGLAVVVTVIVVAAVDISVDISVILPLGHRPIGVSCDVRTDCI